MTLMFNKSLESALSVMACLARVYDDGQTSLTATQIADRQQLNRPIVAKLMTTLARALLVVGKPGPNGGFYLARPPGRIRLLDVADGVGYRANTKCCPFGPHWGGEDSHCPLHHKICDIQKQVDNLLEASTLKDFVEAK